MEDERKYEEIGRLYVACFGRTPLEHSDLGELAQEIEISAERNHSPEVIAKLREIGF